jgi:hypothetical protein
MLYGIHPTWPTMDVHWVRLRHAFVMQKYL